MPARRQNMALKRAPNRTPWVNGASGNPVGRPRKEWAWAGFLERVWTYRTGVNQACWAGSAAEDWIAAGG